MIENPNLGNITMAIKINRRNFLKCGAVAGSGLTILPIGIVSGANAPSNKLNIAVIGVAGRGAVNLNAVKGENIVALCDVNTDSLSNAAINFPKAKTYVDWRKCLEQKDIDAHNKKIAETHPDLAEAGLLDEAVVGRLDSEDHIEEILRHAEHAMVL